MGLTKRQTEALDNARRVLEAAEAAASPSKADQLIQIADRYLTLARESSP
jgi:hypothetical protein